MSEEIHVAEPNLKTLTDYEVRKRTKMFVVPKKMRTQDGLSELIAKAFPVEPGFVRMKTKIRQSTFCQYTITVRDEANRKEKDIPPSNSGSLG